MLGDLQALPRIADINDCLDQYERLGPIGEICTMAHFGPVADGIKAEGLAEPLPTPRSMGFQPPVHFDDLLREQNALMDRRVAAGRTTTYSARKAAFVALDADCRTMTARTTGSSTTAAIRRLILVMIDHADRVSVLQDRMLERARLTELALSMVIYREDHGSYPAALADLHDSGNVENDLFADDKPVHYVPASGLVYSVGPNQRDDKGVYDRPVDKRPLINFLTDQPAPVVDYPDDIAIHLP